MSLLARFHQNVFFDRASAYESVYVDVSGLPDAVCAILGLRVHGRVPIRVVEDHCVGSGQVDPQAPAAGRQDEAKQLGVGVEPVHELLALLDACGTHTHTHTYIYINTSAESLPSPLSLLLSLINRRTYGAIEAHEGVAVKIHEHFQDVQHLRHLGEDEALVSFPHLLLLERYCIIQCELLLSHSPNHAKTYD